jgi:hypothetical protein
MFFTTHPLSHINSWALQNHDFTKIVDFSELVSPKVICQ